MWTSCCGRTLRFYVYGAIENVDEDADEVTVNGAGLTCLGLVGGIGYQIRGF